MSDAPSVTPIAERGYAHPDLLVDCEWVAAHLEDPSVRLLESDEDVLLHRTGHIPGALKLDWVEDLNDAVMRDYVDTARLEALLRERGIDDDTTIVLWLSWRRTRPFAYAVLLVFHFFTHVFFDIGLFPLIMSGAATVGSSMPCG